MNETVKLKYLRIALVLVGLTFTFGVWPLSIVWPTGWCWHGDGRSEYFEMIMGVYATLGVFLLIASRDPGAHKSLIWFTVWSSAVHGAIMGIQSIADTNHFGHLYGDVPALFVVAVALAALAPRRSRSLPESPASD